METGVPANSNSVLTLGRKVRDLEQQLKDKHLTLENILKRRDIGHAQRVLSHFKAQAIQGKTLVGGEKDVKTPDAAQITALGYELKVP